MSPSAGLTPRFCVALVCAVISCPVGANAQTGPRFAVAALESAEPVIHAVPGGRLVFRIQPRGEDATNRRAWTPSDAHTVRFEQGERLEATAWWVSGFYPLPEPGKWLAPAGEWTVTGLVPMREQADAERDGTWFDEGFWVLAIDIPERTLGQRILLDGRPLPLQWLTDRSAKTDASRAPRPEVPFDVRRALGEMLRPRTADPVERWRIRLLTDRIRPTALWGNEPPPERIEDPVLEALAQNLEVRWRAAIGSLARHDPELADRLLYRLTCVTLMPDGSLLPIWPIPGLSERELLDELLRRDNSAARRASLADAWLRAAPEAIAWVMSDSGSRPHEELDVRVALADLTGQGRRCSVSTEGSAARNSSFLDGHTSSVLATPLRRDTDAWLAKLVARVGQWRDEVLAIPGPLVIGPPGGVLGPFVSPWTLRSWLGGVAVAMPESYTTAAMLEPMDTGDAWSLYIECRTPSTGTKKEKKRDFVRVWLGPFGRPSHVLRVQRDGRVIGETQGEPESRSATRVVSWDDGWSAVITIPSNAVSDDRLLQIGLERVDASGIRSSWPRPLLPRQEEPARMLLDLGSWGGIGSLSSEGVRR